MFLLYKAKNQFGGGSWLYAKEELSSAISKEYIFDDNIQKQPPEKATLLKKRLWHRCFNFYEHLFHRTPLHDCFWTSKA